MIDTAWVLLQWVCIFSWSFINFMRKEAADVDTNSFPTPSFALELSHTYILAARTQPQRCSGDREASLSPEEITSGAGVCSGVCTAGQGEFTSLPEQEKREKRGCILSLFLSFCFFFLYQFIQSALPPPKSPCTDTQPGFASFVKSTRWFSV